MTILIKNCRIIDGISDESQGPMDVLVEGRTICSLGENLEPSTDATVIDASDHTLLPGLIDTHVHMIFDASCDPVGHLLGESLYTSLLKGVRNAAVALQRGVTTVRDLGGNAGLPYALRDAVRAGNVPGPRILSSGEVITTTGGHCHFMGHEADDPLGVLRAARLEMKAGADVIKVMATGGSLTPGSSVDLTQFSFNDIQPAVREAHSHGLRVAAHANGLEGISNAVRAGVDSIEHGTYIDHDVMARMRDQGTWWVPTMTPALVILDDRNSALVSTERKASVTRNWNARRNAVVEGIRRGLRFASGTDAGVTLTEHGLVSMEIETFHALGMPPMQSIWTATRWAAELLGIESEVGTIASGMLADMILVEGDPLRDLSRLRAPETVIQWGRIVHSTRTTQPHV